MRCAVAEEAPVLALRVREREFHTKRRREEARTLGQPFLHLFSSSVNPPASRTREGVAAPSVAFRRAFRNQPPSSGTVGQWDAGANGGEPRPVAPVPLSHCPTELV
jgi:hypothetical protein